MNIWNTLAGVSDQTLPHTVRQAPHLNLRVPIYLTSGQQQRIDVGGQRFSSLIVQVTTGCVDVYLSDSPDSLPDFRFVSGLGPQQVWFPWQDSLLSIANPLTDGSISQAIMRVLD